MSARILPIFALAVSAPLFSTATKILPATSTVEANTRSPGPFSAGVLSPVSACWSIIAKPSEITPSTGTTSPVFTTMMSPCRRSPIGTCTSTPSCTTHTNRACFPKTLRSIRFERSSVRFTSVRPRERHQQSTAPGRICSVARQPTTTMTSSVSQPIRRSLKASSCAPLKHGIDV